jgi:predicted Zn-dependent protease
VLIFLLARTEFQARDFAQVIDTLSPLVRATPEDPRLLKLVGLSLLELQRLDEAVPALQHALARAPADAEVQLALGRAYLQNGDAAAAVPLLERRVAADDDGSVHIQLARAYAGVGEREKASVLLERGHALERQAAEKRAAAQILPPQK